MQLKSKPIAIAKEKEHISSNKTSENKQEKTHETEKNETVTLEIQYKIK